MTEGAQKPQGTESEEREQQIDRHTGGQAWGFPWTPRKCGVSYEMQVRFFSGLWTIL